MWHTFLGSSVAVGQSASFLYNQLKSQEEYKFVVVGQSTQKLGSILVFYLMTLVSFFAGFKFYAKAFELVFPTQKIVFKNTHTLIHTNAGGR